MNACAWVLGRAVAYAIATAVAAILIASLISGADAERFATTAYLAALSAALALAIKWFLPDSRQSDPRRPAGPLFPALFTFAAGVGALLMFGAAFASEPGSEALAIAAFFGLVAAAALARGGAIAALRARLARGNRLMVATRYAVAAAVAALAARAMLSSQGEGFAKLAYVAVVVATVAVAASLIAPTTAGAALRRGFVKASNALHAPGSAHVFARTAQYAVATVVAALILASLVPETYAERFTTTAYLATLFAALGIGMSWRLRSGAQGAASGAPAVEWPRFSLTIAALLLAGAALAFSPIAEALAVCACLYLIGATVIRHADVAA